MLDRVEASRSVGLFCVRVAAGALLSALILSISSSLLFSQIRPQVIYGEDDRRDLYQLDTARWQELASATALLVDRTQVRTIAGAGAFYQLATEKLGEQWNLCPGEKFWQQPSAGNCTGFLVGEDVLVSTAHCFLDTGACETTAVVFDYSYRHRAADPSRLSRNSVYYCKEVLERVYEIGGGLDFAVVRLDRAVQGRKTLTLMTQGEVAKDEAVAVIGHPLGLPTKLSQGTIRSVRNRDYFIINADLWEGSSGSPVFDVHTGVVTGLVARGEQDFVARGNCQVTKVCAPDKCDGEQIIRARRFAEFVTPHL